MAVFGTGEYEGLVMDLGVAEGSDTAYYLAKGFKVIAVEADTGMAAKLRARFAGEIEAGALLLLNFAASDAIGTTLEIFAHNTRPRVSGVSKRTDVPDDYTMYQVPTIDWRTLAAQAGVPRYLKIDIEGGEMPFLRGMQVQSASAGLPEFMSVECYAFAPIEMMHALGYRRFKLVDQQPPGGFQLPARQREGRVLATADFAQTSGPFGLDVFEGDWLDFAAVRPAWDVAAESFARTWFDCHAWRPN